MNINTLIFGVIVFVISLFIGYLAEKRIKNKSMKKENDDKRIKEHLQVASGFGFFDDETINNMF